MMFLRELKYLVVEKSNTSKFWIMYGHSLFDQACLRCSVNDLSMNSSPMIQRESIAGTLPVMRKIFMD